MPLVTTTATVLVSIGIGSATAAALAPVVVGTVASVGISLLADAIAPADAVTPAGAAASGLEKETSESTVYPRTWPVGIVLTAGSKVYEQVSDVKPDGTTHSGPEQNRYYDAIHALADVECNALLDIQINDEWVPNSFDESTAGKMGSTIESFDRNGTNAWLKWFPGTVGQSADQRMVEASRERNDTSMVWTSAHKLSGVAYTRGTFKFDEKKHTQFPEWVALFQGAKMYDHRKDSTNGGSGSHRYATSSTWEFTQNPAVVLAHFVRGWKHDGKHYVGFQNITPEMMDLDSFEAAADACNENVALKAGGTEKRYNNFGFEFTVDMPNSAIAETLLSAMAGRLIWTGYRWRLFAGVAQTTEATITDDDLVVTESREYDPKFGRADLVNRVMGQYCEPEQDYSIVAAQPRMSSEDVEADGDTQLTQELELHAVQSNTQAQRIMEICRRQSREQARHRICLPMSFFRLEAGDWIEWTSTRWGYVVKKFRIDRIELTHDLKVWVDLAETNNNIYAWDEDEDELDKTIKNLSPGGDPDDDVGLAITPYTFVDRPYTANAEVGIGATWVDLENRRIGVIEFEWRRESGSGRTYSARVDADKLVWETTSGIKENTAYQVRARPRFRDASYGTWTEWTDGEITSDFLFDATDAPVPAFSNFEGQIHPSTGDKRRALIAIVWTTNSMRWPTTGDPVDGRVVGIEVRYRQDGEGINDWQSETSRNTPDRSFRIFKGIRPDTVYEYQARFLFRDGNVGTWTTLAEVTIPALFNAGTAPVPDVAGATITASTQGGDGGTQRAFFKIAIPSNADARIRGVLFEYKRDAEADSEAVQKFFIGYTSIRLAEGIQKRTSYSFRAAFRFDQDYTGNFSAWRTGQVANDYLADPPDDAGADNEVTNWSFERADSNQNTGAMAWTHETGSGWSRTLGNAEHGDYSLARSGTGNTAVEPVVERRLETRPGNKFTALIYVKRTGSVTFTAMGVRIVFRSKGGDVEFTGESIASVGTTYEPITLKDVEAPTSVNGSGNPTFSVAVRIFVTGQSGGGTLYVDSISLRRQAKGRDIELLAVDGPNLKDGGIIEAKFDAAVVLPVAAKVRIDGSTTMDANKPADVINAVTAQRVDAGRVRTQDSSNTDMLSSFFENGGTGSARSMKGAKLSLSSVEDEKILNVRRNKVYIESSGVSGRTLADVMDAAGKVQGAELVASSVDNAKISGVNDTKVTVGSGSRKLSENVDSVGRSKTDGIANDAILKEKVTDNEISILDKKTSSAFTVSAGSFNDASVVAGLSWQGGGGDIVLYKKNVIIITSSYRSNGSSISNVACQVRWRQGNAGSWNDIPGATELIRHDGGLGWGSFACNFAWEVTTSGVAHEVEVQFRSSGANSMDMHNAYVSLMTFSK